VERELATQLPEDLILLPGAEGRLELAFEVPAGASDEGPFWLCSASRAWGEERSERVIPLGSLSTQSP
jgi:hypothetical protein